MNQQSASSPLPVERTAAAVALDNLIRRQLRVADPRDPGAVALALRDRYADERQALEQEASGLPFFKVTRIDARAPAQDSTRVEERQARDDVNTDLRAMVGNALLKDVHPELRGWSQAIRSAVADGLNAARFALDPWQRDRAMAARRLLGDYARVARYVGTLTPNLSTHYRQLAKSLDEVAGVILVSMGDALAHIGNGGGRFLMQAPASELQGRRDAVIFALRNLVGTAQEGYGPNDWPRGLVAYRQFLSQLESNGLSDLRALFQENNVARALDDLIHLTSSSTAEDLRALGATAPVSLDRFRRLIQFGRNLVSPSSPPLAAYLSAIRLFLDAFEHSASGYRLLFVSRPPIVFYGLYGTGGPDDATQRLINLIIRRGELAEQADCYLGCGCAADKVSCQMMLDKILYDVDRAVDLYTLGTDPAGTGEPEQRAAAYGAVIHAFLHEVVGHEVGVVCDDGKPVCADVERGCVEAGSPLEDLLLAIRDLLWYAGSLSSANAAIQNDGLDTAALDRMQQQLCLQRQGELQWESLLQTMAPRCLHADGALAATEALVQSALDAIVGLGTSAAECPDASISIPPHHETSLDTLANDVLNNGFGRVV